MPAAPLNIAVIGLGWWGRIIVPLIKTSDRLRVVRVADPAPAAAGFAADHGLPLGSFDDALRDPQVQGVVVCTPHTQHTEQIVRAAQAKKHVFCEKPLSLSRADVLRAVDACNRNGVKLAVGHEKRFEPLGSLKWQAHVYGEPAAGLAQACAERGLELHSFAWRERMRHAGVSRGALYLVRPDGYIGLSDSRGDARVLREYWDNIARPWPR